MPVEPTVRLLTCRQGGRPVAGCPGQQVRKMQWPCCVWAVGWAFWEASPPRRGCFTGWKPGPVTALRRTLQELLLAFLCKGLPVPSVYFFIFFSDYK